MSGDTLPYGLGELFPDGNGERILSVKLPSGRLVWPYPGNAEALGLAPATRPVYWLSDEPVNADLWTRLRQDHDRSGLWPVLAEASHYDPESPWVSGDVVPNTDEDIEAHDAATVMAEVWAEWAQPQHGEEDLDYDFEDLEPFGRDCPGLAPAGDAMATPEQTADWFADLIDDGTARLLLVPARRSADVLTALGWQGPVNHSDEKAPLSAMLRSWEDRFGARVVRMGSDTLDVSVAAPPSTTEHAVHVAAEHWVSCPDNIVQGPGTLTEYATQIQGKNSWSFWWD